jgi:hypothetical protein
MSRNSSAMRTFYLYIVGCTSLLLYVCTSQRERNIVSLRQCMCAFNTLQNPELLRRILAAYILRSYQADLEWKPVCMCVLTRQKKRSGDVCRCYPPLLVHAVQTEIYSPCVKMLSARWGSQVIPAGS